MDKAEFGSGIWIFLPLVISFIISIVFHIVGFIFVSIWINHIFFKEEKVVEEEEEYGADDKS